MAKKPQIEAILVLSSTSVRCMNLELEFQKTKLRLLSGILKLRNSSIVMRVTDLV